MTKWIFVLAVLVMAASLFVVALWNGAPSDQSYIEQIEKSRKEKDKFFKSSQSPLPEPLKSKFEGLAYFNINLDFRFDARIEPFADPEPIQLPTTNGALEDFLKYAKVHFTHQKTPYTFIAYLSVKDNKSLKEEKLKLFIPFKDLTSGQSTYQGGRYLDITYMQYADPTVSLDFNLAYHPYCVFNPEYACVIPPADNFIGIFITVGEKN